METWILLTAYSALSDGTIADPNSNSTARLAYDSADIWSFNDSHVIWKGVCHFLLMIYSNLGPFSYRFRHMASFY